MRNTITLLLTLSVALIFGCSSKIQVTGEVTFEDGSPLTTGEVRFESDGFLASGKIQKDGSYTLTSIKQDDGVPKGEYKVSVVAMDYSGVDPKLPLDKVKPPTSLVAAKYSSAETSGLVCSVVNTTKFHIKVEKPKK